MDVIIIIIRKIIYTLLSFPPDTHSVKEAVSVLSLCTKLLNLLTLTTEARASTEPSRTRKYFPVCLTLYKGHPSGTSDFVRITLFRFPFIVKKSRRV